MPDDQIVQLYWQREEHALQETEQKYGRYLFQIAYHVLSDQEDSKECVNDTYYKAWKSIPPHRPGMLSAYLGKITRQLAIDRYRMRGRAKRLPSEYVVSLADLEECIPDGKGIEQHVELKLLAESINQYLGGLTPQARNTFIGRYYFMDTIREVAAYYQMSEPKVKSLLYRTRKGLKQYLEQEGFAL